MLSSKYLWRSTDKVMHSESLQQKIHGDIGFESVATIMIYTIVMYAIHGVHKCVQSAIGVKFCSESLTFTT